MLKINKKVEYALMALKFMSEQSTESNDSLICARQICEIFKTPFDTTAKVMQTMNNHGLLTSVKGIKGGYRLNRSLSTISYMELVEMIEGKRPESVCHNHHGRCELYSSCNIVTPIDALNRKVSSFLDHLTLAELLTGDLYSLPSLDLHARLVPKNKEIKEEVHS